MFITMLETRRGCEDGFCVRRFYAGCSYDVAHMLACEFLSRGWAVRAQPFDARGNVAN